MSRTSKAPAQPAKQPVQQQLSWKDRITVEDYE